MPEYDSDKAYERFEYTLDVVGVQIDENVIKVRDESLKLFESGLGIEDAMDQAFKNTNYNHVTTINIRDAMVESTLSGYGMGTGIDIDPRDLDVLNSTMEKRPWDPKGLSLSNLVTGSSEDVQEQISKTIRRSIDQARASTDIASDLYEGYGYGTKTINGKTIKGSGSDFKEYNLVQKQEINKSLQKLAEARINGERIPNLDEKIKRLRRTVESGRTAPLRASYSELLDAVESGGKTKVKQAYSTAIEEKTRYAANRIAITETERTLAMGTLSRTVDDDECVGYIFKLSVEHYIYDICNIIAKVNTGAGEGFYSKNNAPVLPIHPYGQSRLKPFYAIDPIEQSNAEVQNSLGEQVQKDYAEGKDMSSITSQKGIEELKEGKTPKIYNRPLFESPENQLKDMHKYREAMKNIEVANPGKIGFQPKDLNELTSKGRKDVEHVLRKVPPVKYTQKETHQTIGKMVVTPANKREESHLRSISSKRTTVGQINEFRRRKDKLSPSTAKVTEVSIQENIINELGQDSWQKALGLGRGVRKSPELASKLDAGIVNLSPAAKNVDNWMSSHVSPLVEPKTPISKVFDSNNPLESWYTPKKKLIYWSGDEKVLAHEYAHHIELSLPGDKRKRAQSLSNEFIRSRKEGSLKWFWINRKKKTGYWYVQDKFLEQYTGRLYDDEVSVLVKYQKAEIKKAKIGKEIYSEGIEYLYNDPLKFMFEDMDHFVLTRAFLSGEF